MNWDISIGQGRQLYGRAVQALGRRLNQPAMVLNGERAEYCGRLQMRYGVLKHRELWGANLARIPTERDSVRFGE